MTTRSNPPEIVVRGADVFEAARHCMRPPLTVIGAFQGPQVSQHTFEAYRDGRVTRLQCDVLGRLCWFFGCTIDDLLAVRPRDRREDLPPIAIVRTTVPTHLSPPGAIRVIKYIPAEIAMAYAHMLRATDRQQPNVFAMTRGGSAGAWPFGRADRGGRAATRMADRRLGADRRGMAQAPRRSASRHPVVDGHGCAALSRC